MAGYSVNPGPFKAVAADPEGTLERLEDYCRTMEMVFRLSRRVTSTGTKIDFDDSEKKDMIQIEGGEDMMQLFRFVGKVQDTDSYQQAIGKIKAALKKTGNRTSAVHRLYTAHSQGDQTFDVWHRTVRKAAQLTGQITMPTRPRSTPFSCRPAAPNSGRGQYRKTWAMKS